MQTRGNRRLGLLITLALLATLSYPLSFFPACWIFTRMDGWWIHTAAGRALSDAYSPQIVAFCESPDGIQHLATRLIDWGAARNTEAWFIRSPSPHRSLVWNRPG